MQTSRGDQEMINPNGPRGSIGRNICTDKLGGNEQNILTLPGIDLGTSRKCFNHYGTGSESQNQRICSPFISSRHGDRRKTACIHAEEVHAEVFE